MKSKNVSRRDFLKTSAASIAALSLPIKTLEAIAASVDNAFKKEPFDPNREYGYQLPIVGRPEQREVLSTQALEYLLKYLRKHIPEKYLHKVQFRRSVPINFDRAANVAWYYSPSNKPGYLGPHGKWEFSPLDGCFIWVKA